MTNFNFSTSRLTDLRMISIPVENRFQIRCHPIVRPQNTVPAMIIWGTNEFEATYMKEDEEKGTAVAGGVWHSGQIQKGKGGEEWICRTGCSYEMNREYKA